MNISEITYSSKAKQLLSSVELDKIQAKDWSDTKFDYVKAEVKNHYKKDQSFICPYCKQKFQISHNAVWDIEHIIPRSLKPQFMFEPKNLCVACKDCNGPKSDVNVLKNKNRKTFPTKSTDYLIVHPHFHNYNDHIEPIVVGVFYRALSDEGKFTIINCDLLRFYKYTDRDSILRKEDAIVKVAKKIAFSTSEEEKEEYEQIMFELLSPKYKGN